MKILLLHTSSNYPLFLFLHRFRLVFAEMSFKIQRYLEAKSDVLPKEISQKVSKLRRTAELKIQSNHCHSLFHLYSILIHASAWGVRVIDPISHNITASEVLSWGCASDQAFGWVYSKKVRCNSVATVTGYGLDNTRAICKNDSLPMYSASLYP